MGPRPAHLDLAKGRREAFEPPRMNFRPDMPSPRTGDVPPALSPLDAFAMQSRMLARRFEEEREQGRRISRLPPVVVAKEMSNRPGYFRNLSAGSGPSGEESMGELPEVHEEASPVSAGTTHASAAAAARDDPQHEKSRPKSHYPVLGHARRSNEFPAELPGAIPYFYPDDSSRTTVTATSTSRPTESSDYFGISAPRAASPEPANVDAPSPTVPSLTSSVDTVASHHHNPYPHPRSRTNESQRSQRSQLSERGLAPPQSPRYPPRSPRSPRSFQSIRSVPPDSGDEDAVSMTGSHHALPSARKFSGSSNMSRPQSPFSPWMNGAHRSPSMTSEYSMSGGSQPHPRPTANFSRPMSSSERPSCDLRQSMDSRPSLEIRPSTDLPLRHPSAASHSTSSPTPTTTTTTYSAGGSRQNSSDEVKTPYAATTLSLSTPNLAPERASEDLTSPITSDATPSANQLPSSSSSYIYAKYALPRGRAMERISAGGIRDSWIQRQFTWDKPVADPTKDLAQINTSLASFDTATARALSPIDVSAAAARPGRELALSTSALRSRSADPRAHEPSSSSSPLSPSPSAAPTHRSTPSTHTESTDRTIRATPLHQKSLSADLTAEEHLEIGIQAHSAGETTKSTYHLRLAATAGLPTAMLLYALACRHGWGMRANQAEGVRWLRKAVESTASLDVAQQQLDVASAAASNSASSAAAQREQRAQYALAVYELGVSSLKGWGCPKDKPLALRCFEIAGSWGDADALAEAGYCYAQGIGCKKDLWKAAALYRRAEESGMSMAGNSWIYKPKYMTDDPNGRRPDTAVSTHTTASTWSRDFRPGTSATTATFNSTSGKHSTSNDGGGNGGGGRARSRSIFGRRKDRGTTVNAPDPSQIPLPLPSPLPQPQ